MKLKKVHQRNENIILEKSQPSNKAVRVKGLNLRCTKDLMTVLQRTGGGGG